MSSSYDFTPYVPLTTNWSGARDLIKEEICEVHSLGGESSSFPVSHANIVGSLRRGIYHLISVSEEESRRARG